VNLTLLIGPVLAATRDRGIVQAHAQRMTHVVRCSTMRYKAEHQLFARWRACALQAPLQGPVDQAVHDRFRQSTRACSLPLLCPSGVATLDIPRASHSAACAELAGADRSAGSERLVASPRRHLARSPYTVRQIGQLQRVFPHHAAFGARLSPGSVSGRSAIVGKRRRVPGCPDSGGAGNGAGRD